MRHDPETGCVLIAVALAVGSVVLLGIAIMALRLLMGG